jgi:hypothetical protein
MKSFRQTPLSMMMTPNVGFEILPESPLDTIGFFIYYFDI